MIEDKCKHLWKGPFNSGRDCNGGFVPGYFVCNSCGISLEVSEVSGLEQLEIQSKEIKNLKKHRKLTALVSMVALLVSCLALIL